MDMPVATIIHEHPPMPELMGSPAVTTHSDRDSEVGLGLQIPIRPAFINNEEGEGLVRSSFGSDSVMLPERPTKSWYPGKWQPTRTLGMHISLAVKEEEWKGGWRRY